MHQEWRWRVSNPRPSVTQWAFSERSRLRIVGGGAATGELHRPVSDEGVPGDRSEQPFR